MSMPSPFELGSAIGGNISTGFREAADVSAIDKILGEASQSQDPNAVNNAMHAILRSVSPQNQQQAVSLLQGKVSQMKQKQTEEALQKQGLEPSLANLDVGIQKEIIKGKLGKGAANTEGAAKALDQLESLIGKPGIGLLNANFKGLSKEALSNKGKFESTKAAVLPLFKQLFPRGMTEKEFLIVMEDFMPKYNDSEAKIKGKIEGLRGMLQSGQVPGQTNAKVPFPQSIGSNNKPIEMRDAEGTVYDIPSHLVEQAKAQGLK